MATIRPARPDDRDAIREITLAAYSAYATIMEPDAWKALESAVRNTLEVTEQVERFVAVDDDDAVVGSVMLFAPSSNAYGGQISASTAPELRMLAVRDAWRGRGVGEALVKACAARAREMGAAALGLHTSRSMRAAIRLYRRLGFERAPELDFQPPGAEVVEGYRLPLDEPPLR